ncbi:hypothetical protein CsSME_00020258 [Camellia sinensis var. sinensis]
MIFILNLQLQWVSKENPSVRIHYFSFLVRYAECFMSYFGVNTVGTSLGNEFSTSSLANNGAEGSLAHSEIPTVYVSDTTSAEEGPHISVVSNSDGGFHIDNRRLDKEEGVAVPCLEILDMYELITRSGRRGGKFQRKPKIQIGRQKPGADTSHPDAVESIPCPQQAQSIPSETEYMNEGSNLAFPSNNIVDFPSLRFDDSTSELPVNEPTTNFMDASHSEASIPGEHPEAAPKIPEKVVICSTSILSYIYCLHELIILFN